MSAQRKTTASGTRPPTAVFMGTPAFAARVLEALIAAQGRSFTLAAVVTAPDAARGRGLELAPSEVARVGARAGLPLLKPATLKGAQFVKRLGALAPDLLVVVAYGRILPQPVIDLARLTAVNLHASLLPRHRGAAPVPAAILAGDRETGVTVMRITREMDAGPILMQRATTILPDDTRATLEDRLCELGAALLVDALERIAAGTIVETPQDPSLATYTKLLSKADAVIDWSLPAQAIERMARAYDPWPVARTTLAGAPLMVYRAACEAPVLFAEPPGTVVAVEPEPVVQCGAGCLRLVEVKLAGRRKVSGAELARGRFIKAGDRLGR